MHKYMTKKAFVLFIVGVGIIFCYFIFQRFNKSNVYKKIISIKEDKENSSENFKDFIYIFSSDSNFQKSRIIYPLIDCYLDSVENIVCDTVYNNEHFPHLKLIDMDQNLVFIYNDSLSHIDNNIKILSIENNISEGSTYYYFINKQKKWFLFKREAYMY